MFEDFKVPTELMPTDPRFGCGPSLIPTEFMQGLAETGAHLLGTSHRKPGVKNLVKGIQEGLTEYFNIPSDYQVVLGNGGATLLFDMIGLGIVEKQSTHFTCGEFSSKWYKAHNNIPWINAVNKSVDFGNGITPENDKDSDVICGTLNETSTGVIIDSLPTVDENTLLCIDATSGAGQVPCDVSKTDMFIFSPQKVFASEGGLFVAIMSPKAIERALKINGDDSRYIPDIMNWKTAIDNSAKNQTYNTPSVSTLYFLNEQIKLMNKIGYQGVQDEAWKKANHVYSWAESKDYLSCYISEEKYRSNAVATIDVDEKFPIGDLLKVLDQQKAVYGIDAYRKLGRNQVRIGLFHNIKLTDIEKLTSLLSAAIESV